MRLRQYYPGQEVINEHNDPNLAETPHYKEKQTILPNPIIGEVTDGKKPQTPVKRTHDGKIKKDKKDPLKSPMINEQSSPKEVCVKADEAKIDMRKLVIVEHKTHKKSSSSSTTNSMSSTKKHSTSSSPSSIPSDKSSSKKDKNKEKDKHKSRSNSESHRSHSSDSSKKSHPSDKHRRDENRKSSSSSQSNHSSSSEKPKSTEVSSKKSEAPKSQPKSGECTPKPDTANSVGNNASESPVQVTSSHSNASPPLATSVLDTPQSPAPETPSPVINHPPEPSPAPPQTEQQMPRTSEQPLPPAFNILPPLPKDEMPEIPPPPPPPPIEVESRPPTSKGNVTPDSSTQQSPQSPTPAPKVRKLNNGDKSATTSDLLGSIMASMDSPRTPSNF